MKPQRDIGKSRNARLNQARVQAAQLLQLLDTECGTPHNVVISRAEFWAEGRDLVAQITQCFNEANAHNNDIA